MASTCVIQSGTHISAALRVVYGGKAYKRGVEYGITTSLAIMMMRVDAILSAIPNGYLRVQCSTIKNARHERSPDMAKTTLTRKSYGITLRVPSSSFTEHTYPRQDVAAQMSLRN